MVQHIVLLKWKPGTTEEEVREAFSHARTLTHEIPALHEVTLGRDRTGAEHGFTHALIAHVADEDALQEYLSHPSRHRYIDQWLKPIEEQRIEVDVPEDMAHHRDPRRDWEWGATVGMGLPLDD